VYVKDVVKANILASHSGTGVYNIAAGKSTSLNTLVTTVANTIGVGLVLFMRRPGQETSGTRWLISAAPNACATLLITV
jgi:nucleoside-diphosphate-sugar epimerase